MDENISWERYRSFLAVMQHGSLSAAARALGSTQPTLGRHVAALEKQLGLVLFTRTQGGLVASKEAAALLPYAKQMASTAAALNRLASSQGKVVQGVVRVTASDIIGVEWLPPVLSRLNAQHPRLQIELDLSDHPQDLLHREADIAVRMFRPTQTQLIARKVGNIPLGLYASPHYVARRGKPSRIQDLAQHALVGYDQTTGFIRQAGKKLAVTSYDRARFALACDSNVAQMAMIKAGLGIGFCQAPLAERYHLEPVLAEQMGLALDIWVVMHEDLKSSKGCRAVFDALAEGLAEPGDYSL